jgi:hypothetical protein
VYRMGQGARTHHTTLRIEDEDGYERELCWLLTD